MNQSNTIKRYDDTADDNQKTTRMKTEKHQIFSMRTNTKT